MTLQIFSLKKYTYKLSMPQQNTFQLLVHQTQIPSYFNWYPLANYSLINWLM